ncbi:MAG TPA: aldolase/citrate lyase family protein, partial [Solirubrobacterales bacterium]|nr:aldolase/citrate lyase family protein [Solirubrobacterales bacterium]
HRALRALFGIAWLLLARWTPPPLHRWRRLVLALFGARLDPTARVYGSVRVWYPPNLTMGRHACLGPGVRCYSMDKVTLGDYATVSQYAHLCAGTHLVDDPDYTLVTRPILIHAILETAQGVTNVEDIAAASPRMQGMSFGPADLAASRRMKTTRVGGGHPGYRSMEDPVADDPEAPRVTAQQDPWHYSIARMVDACTANDILPFYGPFGDIKDLDGCETQFRSAFLLGCVGAWSLHPAQIAVAKKVFSPPVDEVIFAKKVIEAIPDGRGVHMIDGKMQDDATWKQCKVMVELAEMLAAKDPELKEQYGF